MYSPTGFRASRSSSAFASSTTPPYRRFIRFESPDGLQWNLDSPTWALATDIAAGNIERQRTQVVAVV